MSTYNYDRTASVKFDVHQTAMDIIRKSQEVQYEGFKRIVARMEKILQTKGLKLDVSRSGFDVGGNSSDGPRPEGTFFVEPDKDTILNAGEVKDLWISLFDLYPSVRGHGDGWIIEIGG